MLTVNMDGFETHEEWLELSLGQNEPIRVELKPAAKPPKSSSARRKGPSKPSKRRPSANAKATKPTKVEGKSKTQPKPRDKDYTLDPFAR